MTKPFMHIYIEEKALGLPLTRNVAERFPDARRIFIGHYKDVFNRPLQDFQLQKTSKNLILAVKEDNLVYKGPSVCQNFGHDLFYYSSVMLNCIYNCDYCFLQGMYPSANLVAFVNTDDFTNAAAALEQGSFLTVSYDTDLLAFEGVVPYSAMWIAFAGKNPDKVVEIRTKSSNYHSISGLQPYKNVVLAWTLTPEPVRTKYEKCAPSLSSRIKAIREAISDGWKVRLCFDPLLVFPDWHETYASFLDDVFSGIPSEGILDIGVGPFRMNTDYLKRIRKKRSDSDILYFPFESRNGVCSYPSPAENALIDFFLKQVEGKIEKEKIFLYT